MRHLKKLCAACVLTITLTLSAPAGEMLGGITAPPPPPPESQATAQGDMPAGVTATDSATEALVNLLQSLLSLF